MLKMNRFAILFSTLVTASAAQAQAPDWKNLMTGVDGVIIYCDSSTRQSYAERMCKDIGTAIEKAFEGSGLRIVNTGFVLTGVARDDKQPAESVTAPLKTAEGMAHPMIMGIVLKGTDASNPGIYGRVQVMIPFKGAVDAGSPLPPKAGDLFLAERAVVGDGPRKRLAAAISKNLSGQVDELVANIRVGLPESKEAASEQKAD